MSIPTTNLTDVQFHQVADRCGIPNEEKAQIVIQKALDEGGSLGEAVKPVIDSFNASRAEMAKYDKNSIEHNRLAELKRPSALGAFFNIHNLSFDFAAASALAVVGGIILAGPIGWALVVFAAIAMGASIAQGVQLIDQVQKKAVERAYTDLDEKDREDFERRRMDFKREVEKFMSVAAPTFNTNVVLQAPNCQGVSCARPLESH